MTALTYQSLLDDVRKLFSPAPIAADRTSMSVGAELEMIPVSVTSGKRVLARGTSPSGEDFVSAMAREYGWKEEAMGVDPSSWVFDDGRVTFEPGGQIEFSSAVFPTAGALLDSLAFWLPRFSDHAARMGIELKFTGIEESASVESIPLQLQRDRYRMMTHYFDSLGPFGVVMMRQTASLQINLDRGEAPAQRWRLLNALAPYMVALFANSPRYEGKDTDRKSYRSHVWRNLDPRRTGIIYESAKEAERFLKFALDAPVILLGEKNGFPPFRELLARGVATSQDWDTHLSTLFPEIRPRDYFEIRSIDSIPPSHIPAAIVFVTGLAYCGESQIRAEKVIGDPDPALLILAGERGLDWPVLRERVTELARIAMEGCEELGPSYIQELHLERAGEFFRKKLSY